MSKPIVLMIGAYPEWDMAPMEEATTCASCGSLPTGRPFSPRRRRRRRAIATRGELGASAALIDRCPKLEIIACYGVGFDAIDIKRAKERGVRVTNTPDVSDRRCGRFRLRAHSRPLRKVVAGDAHVRSGAWSAARCRSARA